MAKIETAAQREENVKVLSRRITELCSGFYDRAMPEQKEALYNKLDDLEAMMIAYRRYDAPWDSRLIDVVATLPLGEGNQNVKVKSKAFSTFDSVMDHARNLFSFVGGRH